MSIRSKTDPLGGPLDTGDDLDETKFRLNELGLRARSKIKYEYDFGDGWIHELLLEKVLPPEPNVGPICLDGARACPAEDSGGPWGYAEKLAILADPKHPQHDDIAEWLGEGFDREAFNLTAINARLASLRQRWNQSTARKRRR